MRKIELKKEGVDNSIPEFANVSLEYRELVMNADKYSQDFFINNSTIEHAKFLIYMLINRAKKNIKIFTGNLSEVYYQNGIILQILEKKLQDKVKVEIVTKNNIESKEILNLKKKYNDLLFIYILKEPTKIVNHFLLVDNTSFRVEYQHSEKDINKSNFKVYAKANFYNQEIGGYIGGIFQDLRGISSPI